MPALATFLAILGWIVCGLILTGIGWVFSRWLGKVAVPDAIAGGKATEQAGHRRKGTRTLAQTNQALTHGERSTRL